MAVTANQLIQGQDMHGKISGKVLAAKHLYQGCLAFIVPASGFVTDVIAAGVNVFAGILVGEVDNSAGANGDLECEMWSEGVYELTGSGFSQATVGSLIYAVDNYTVNTTSASQTKIGRCVRYISSTRIAVKIDVQQA